MKQVEDVRHIIKTNGFYMGSSFLQSKNENHRNSITKQNLNQKTSSTSQSRVPRNAAIEYFDTKQAEYTTKAFSSFGNNTAGDFSRSTQADTGKQTPFTQVQLNNKNNLMLKFCHATREQ